MAYPSRGDTPWDLELKAYLDEREEAILAQVAGDIADPNTAIGEAVADLVTTAAHRAYALTTMLGDLR